MAEDFSEKLEELRRRTQSAEDRKRRAEEEAAERERIRVEQEQAREQQVRGELLSALENIATPALAAIAKSGLGFELSAYRFEGKMPELWISQMCARTQDNGLQWVRVRFGVPATRQSGHFHLEVNGFSNGRHTQASMTGGIDATNVARSKQDIERGLLDVVEEIVEPS